MIIREWKKWNVLSKGNEWKKNGMECNEIK